MSTRQVGSTRNANIRSTAALPRELNPECGGPDNCLFGQFPRFSNGALTIVAITGHKSPLYFT
jgi:hypothetical protein